MPGNLLRRLAVKLKLQRDRSTTLFEQDLLLRVLGHFEQRRQTWEARGASAPINIGHYFEFGVYNGDTLVDFWRTLGLVYGRHIPSNWQIFAFDSFEGLPESDDRRDLHLQAGAGSYRSLGEAHIRARLERDGMPSERLHVFPGFYEQSLTTELRDTLLAKGVRASFVNIDCDLYSSTKVALDWLEPLLHDGAIVYFDDIYFYNCNPHKGELLAIREFNEARRDSGLALAPYFDVGHRCYMYWRNEDIEPHRLEFRTHVSG